MKFVNLFKRNKGFPGEEGENGIGKKAVDNNSGLSYFYYSYDGTIGGNNFHYSIKKEEDGFVFKYDTMEHNDYGGMKMPVDSSVMERLNDLYLSCRVAEWDGFSKYNSMICDGAGFSLDLKFNDGKYLRANGSNAFPEGYRKFCDGMDVILTPLRDKLLDEARQKKIEKGITGRLLLLIIQFNQRGASGSDEYSFLLSESGIRSSNYEINVKSNSGEFFPSGEYKEYRAVPDTYIPLAQIQDMIEKYKIIKWCDHEGTAPDPDDKEWYQIHFSFDDKSFLNSHGTVYPENYSEFRRDFLQLMADTYQRIQKDLK